MIHLIMLCGQGNIGKSTFAKKYFFNDCIIRIDDLVQESIDKKYSPTVFKEYIQLIQQKIDEKCEKIILDFAHDNIDAREKVLSQLILPQNEIIFTTISLRPSIEQLIYNTEHRCNKKLNQTEKDKIISIYNCFQYPTKTEFENYHFSSVNCIIITDF